VILALDNINWWAGAGNADGHPIIADAVLSKDRRYRYTLSRTWDCEKGNAMFIGLNPSTADESENDPTIRRCMRFALEWGYGGIVVCNLFAFRATDPRAMKAATDPVGPLNDEMITTEARDAGLVIACWGNHGQFLSRSDDVRKFLSSMKCFGLTKRGEPKHPLYLRADTKLVELEDA